MDTARLIPENPVPRRAAVSTLLADTERGVLWRKFSYSIGSH